MASARPATPTAPLARLSNHWQQALALFTELGTPEGDQVRAQLAAADLDYDAANLRVFIQGHGGRPIALCRETGDRDTEVHTLVSLGVADLRLARCQQATDHLQRALALSRENGHRGGSSPYTDV